MYKVDLKMAMDHVFDTLLDFQGLHQIMSMCLLQVDLNKVVDHACDTLSNPKGLRCIMTMSVCFRWI